MAQNPDHNQNSTRSGGSHRVKQGVKHKGAEKVARIPVKVEPQTERLRKRRDARK